MSDTRIFMVSHIDHKWATYRRSTDLNKCTSAWLICIATAQALQLLWQRWQPARNALMTLLKQIFRCVQLTETAIVQTQPMVNKYFGVGVVSEPRMVSAGVEPWMGSSTD